jgi:hypothetical protein
MDFSKFHSKNVVEIPGFNLVYNASYYTLKIYKQTPNAKKSRAKFFFFRFWQSKIMSTQNFYIPRCSTHSGL